jgi:hypothetical protein
MSAGRHRPARLRPARLHPADSAPPPMPSSLAPSVDRSGRNSRRRSSPSAPPSCRCASTSRSFANIRPGLLYRELTDASPLKTERIPDGIDIVCIRELTGGIYFGQPKSTTTLPDGDVQAVDTMVYRKSEIERITARSAITAARAGRRSSAPWTRPMCSKPPSSGARPSPTTSRSTRPTSRSATCMSTTPPCSSRATPTSSTCS